MTSDRVERIIVQPAAESAVDRPGRRRQVAWWSLAVLLLAAALSMFLLDRNQRIDDVSALAQQVRDLGGTPVVQAPVPGPEGRPGRDGRDGVDGQDGADGRDGVTPTCVSEPSQCRGADGDPGEAGQPGQDGQPGKDGKDGRDGVDGQPPAMWTWTDTAGREQSCTRDPESPDSAPRYACTAPSTGPPGTTTNSPLPPLLGG